MHISKTNKKELLFKSTIGALLSAGASSSVSAVIVKSTTANDLRPPSSPGSIFWDVDNDGTNDFALKHSFSSRFTFTSAFIGNENGGRIMLRTDRSNERALQKLNSGQSIGVSVAGYFFKSAAENYITVTSSNGNVAANAADQDWSLNDTGFIGFRFTSGADTHYGWLSLTIDGNPAGSGFQINEAYYETTANTNIQAGAIPEPASAALGLGALALGAAGLRRTRRSRQAA